MRSGRYDFAGHSSTVRERILHAEGCRHSRLVFHIVELAIFTFGMATLHCGVVIPKWGACAFFDA